MVNFALASRERQKYQMLKEDPNPTEREKSKRYGKKAIVSAILAALLPFIPLGLIYLFFGLLNGEAIIAGAVLFWIIAIIAIIAMAILSLYYPIAMTIRAIRFTVWQNKLNKQPIGKAAIVITVLGAIIAVGFDILALMLIAGLAG